MNARQLMDLFNMIRETLELNLTEEMTEELAHFAQFLYDNLVRSGYGETETINRVYFQVAASCALTKVTLNKAAEVKAKMSLVSSEKSNVIPLFK